MGKVIELQRLVNEAEIKYMINKVGGTARSVEEVGKIFDEATKDSWKFCLEGCREELLEGGGPEVYFSALATYLRDPKFRAQKRKLDEVRHARLSKLVQLDKSAGQRVKNLAR